jgi:hypothetical protein
VGNEGMPCPDERSETGARVFAVMVESLLSITSVAVQSRLRAGFLSPCRMPILGTRAVSRYKFIMSQKFVMVQRVNSELWRASGCIRITNLFWLQE